MGLFILQFLYEARNMKRECLVWIFLICFIVTPLDLEFETVHRPCFCIGGVSLHQYLLGHADGGEKPYWHNPNYPFHHPYYPGYGYGYPYYFSPSEDKSPYENLEVKQAGELAIMIEPADAEVLVDGYQLMQNEALEYSIGLLTGKHHVEARAKGFKPYREEVEIHPAERTLIYIQLKKE